MTRYSGYVNPFDMLTTPFARTKKPINVHQFSPCIEQIRRTCVVLRSDFSLSIFIHDFGCDVLSYAEIRVFEVFLRTFEVKEVSTMNSESHEEDNERSRPSNVQTKTTLIILFQSSWLGLVAKQEVTPATYRSQDSSVYLSLKLGYLI
ncbi:unnamed protein product [Eruca vesicaria subsp. sativa]|uniref:tRNA (adenine(58)-N(1))-methyltransferase catalytic subunit TRM61 C-terminal domain-containing protein n=1 Tax=Eruca vesicaria subsp. sativa TaxID=29727 RepID=A0ABC8J750_ERUVS|nr:unnamed protein product [Eruca vesicaria subsp. sativa]